MIATALFLLFIPSPSAFSESVEVLSDGGISVRFEKTGDQDQVESFKNTILPEVKSILSDLSSDLGTPAPASGVKISFYSPDTFGKKFPQTINTQIPAFYGRDGIHARADNEVNHILKTTLRHELTHLMIDKNYGLVPAWINEGLAELEERKITVDPEPHNIDYNTLHIAKQDGKYIPLENLIGQGIFGRSHGTVASGLAYTTAFVAVYELKQKSGMDSIRRYMEAVGKGKSPKDEFETVFGLSYEKFNEQLLKTAAEKS